MLARNGELYTIARFSNWLGAAWGPHGLNLDAEGMLGAPLWKPSANRTPVQVLS